MSLEGLNILAIIGAAVLNMALGALWYSPALFGNLFIRWIGKSAAELEAPPTDYLFAFIGSLLAALVLAMIVQATNAATLVDGALTGGLVWLGFAATTTLTYSLFAGPPKKVWALYAAYGLAAFLGMGALLGGWR